MKIEAIAFTEHGAQLACRLRDALTQQGETVRVCLPQRLAAAYGAQAYESLGSWTADAFENADALLFVSASGIAVRAIAAHVRDKFSDPAVVSIDEGGSFVVPLLSGHVGGANDLARTIAELCGAQAAISTATDVQGLFAVDEWARKNNLAILDRTAAKDVSAALLAGAPVGLASELPFEGPLPNGFVLTESAPEAKQPAAEPGMEPAPLPRIGVSIGFDESMQPFEQTLHLVPRTGVLGIGCRRNTPSTAIAQAVDAMLATAHMSEHAVCAVASIDVKSDEQGLLDFAAAKGWQLRFYTAEELAAVPGQFASSDFVRKTVGVDNVCERAACASGAPLAIPRFEGDGVTVALALGTPSLVFPARSASETQQQETTHPLQEKDRL